MDDRIKLAEAMGWWLFKKKYWQPPNVSFEFAMNLWNGKKAINWNATPLPDPFTNPTDDYAVLEWMRTCDFDYFEDFAQEVYSSLKAVPVHYTIGDYARAALKVIE